MNIRIISEHKKKCGATGYGYVYIKPAAGMKRVMAIVNNKTRHIDVPSR